jgi:hypothetical protein
MNMTTKESSDIPSAQHRHRQLPLVSWLVAFPLRLLAAILHVILPQSLEPTISVLLTGGLFGFVVLPVLFLWFLICALEWTGILEHASDANLLKYVGVPIGILYVVQILLLDKSHVQVQDANPLQPQTSMERAYVAFLGRTLDYFDWPCIPWSQDAKLPTTSTTDNKQYIFAVHPHGIHCVPLAYLTTKGSPFDVQFPGLVGSKLTGLAATVMFKLPVVRELFLDMGYIDASRNVASKALEHGRSLFVCTGGEEESMMTTKGEDIVVLSKRKGFVRLALSHGAELVPVFGVGNSDLYHTYSFLLPQRLWIQKQFGIALPLFHGLYFSSLPYPSPGKILIGQPIPTPVPKVKGGRPDEKLVDEYHAKYIAALRALHAKHVHDRVLKIV